jgi:hypothetical protein
MKPRHKPAPNIKIPGINPHTGINPRVYAGILPYYEDQAAAPPDPERSKLNCATLGKTYIVNVETTAPP